MKKFNFQLIIIIFLILFLCNNFAVVGFNKIVEDKLFHQNNDDFYFVHLTDTHIRHRLFNINENTKARLSTVIDCIISFEKKPAFIVITGDLTEWGGSGVTGALNCIAFADCFYEMDGQLYADEDLLIPVYTTPGNHDYSYNRNLKNYHKFIDKNHIDEKDRYIITQGNVSLFFMDSGPNYFLNPFTWFDICGKGLCNCDIEWLKESLNNSSKKKIVLMHHPAVNKRNKWGLVGGVLIKNRQNFIDLCEEYDAELVLAGHTHHAVVYDKDVNLFEDFPLNCSLYSTLYVQSDDCKQGIHYRNISIIGDDIWVEESVELELEILEKNNIKTSFEYIFMNIERYILSLKNR